jgi:hypothetical protein
VDLLISDVGDGVAPSVGAYDITITFDASLLGFMGAAFGDPVLGDQLDLAGFGSITDIDSAVAGSVNLAEVSLDSASTLNSLQAGAFIAVRLTLVGISEGTSSLGIVVNGLGDADGASLAAVSTDKSLVVGAVPVPEPATLIYFATGAAALAMRRHHRNRKPRRRPET